MVKRAGFLMWRSRRGNRDPRWGIIGNRRMRTEKGRAVSYVASQDNPLYSTARFGLIWRD